MGMKGFVVIALAGLALSACVSSGPRPVPVSTGPAPAASGVEGAWVDPNGIVSTFQGGSFTTRTTDTNQTLASGTYVSTSPSLVEINLFSNIKKTTSRVNCAMVTPNQLNCTADSGSQFSLTRRS